MENKTNTKAQNTKAQDTKADNKPLTGEVVQNSGLPIGVDATLREKAIAKIQKAVVSFNAKHWAVAQAIYDVRMSDNFTKSFKNLEDFAVALDTTKGTISKYVNSVELKLYLEDKGVVCDFTMSQVAELLKTFNEHKKNKLDFKGFLDKNAITADMSVMKIREAIKKANGLQIAVKSDAKTADNQTGANSESTAQTGSATAEQTGSATAEQTGVTFDENGRVATVNGMENKITDPATHIDLCVKGVRCGTYDIENDDFNIDLALLLSKYGFPKIKELLVTSGVLSE